MAERKWKVVHDKRGPRLAWHVRLYTPDGHEVPGVHGIRLSEANDMLEMSVSILGGVEYEELQRETV